MKKKAIDYEFVKSKLCGGGECVEVAMLPSGEVAVRGTRPDMQEPLVFSVDEWATFVAGVKAGEFDPPAFTKPTTPQQP